MNPQCDPAGLGSLRGWMFNIPKPAGSGVGYVPYQIQRKRPKSIDNNGPPSSGAGK